MLLFKKTIGSLAFTIQRFNETSGFDRQYNYVIMFTYSRLDDYLANHISSSYTCLVCLFSAHPRKNKYPAMFCFRHLLDASGGEVAARQRRRLSTNSSVQFKIISIFCTQNNPLLNLQVSRFLYIGRAFRYSPENAFYIFNQQIYFII